MGCLLAAMTLAMGCGPELASEGLDAVEDSPPGQERQALFDFYASGGTYTTTTAASPWSELFESYSDNQTVECSTNMGLRAHLETTSGCLIARTVTGSSSTYKRGWTTTYNFRSLAVKKNASGYKARYTDTNTTARFYVTTFQSTSEPFRGVHLFARYNTEDDLYVASLRSNGEVIIQRKIGGTYGSLARGQLKNASGALRGPTT
jgi:hypothetical protein